MAVLIVAGVRLLPGLQAAWQANLGAVAQTRTELSIYRWLNYPIQDAVRRQEQAALAPAVARFQTALARNPANVTANRRLGQIELSQGQYEEARRHLEAAYTADPEQRATRQLLGESYAISGEVEKAVTLWQTVDVRLGQLLIRKWWYEQIGDQSRAGWIAKAVRIMGGPVRDPRLTMLAMELRKRSEIVVDQSTGGGPRKYLSSPGIQTIQDESTMRSLITGGAGFIGSHVARQCIELGHKVTVLGRLEWWISRSSASSSEVHRRVSHRSSSPEPSL